MRRVALAIATVAAATACVPAAAQAATPATCTGGPALEWRAFGEGGKRVVELDSASGPRGFGSAVQPVAVTVIRNGHARKTTWTTSRDQYVYRPKKGEQARFLAVYFEDSSGYGGVNFAPPSPLTVAIPGVTTVVGLLSTLFPGGTITVNLPTQDRAGTYSSTTCVRTLPLTVGEKTARRAAKTKRSF